MLERLKKEFMRDVSAYVTNWKPKEQDGDHLANRIEDEMIREREHSLFSILLSIPFILSCRIKTLTNALFPHSKMNTLTLILTNGLNYDMEYDDIAGKSDKEIDGSEDEGAPGPSNPDK